MGHPVSLSPLGADLRKRDPKAAELIEKPCLVTRGLRKPRAEELSGPFSLPGIPEEGEFVEAWDIIGDLRRPSSAEAPSFAKEAEVVKTSETPPKKVALNPSSKPTEAAKDSKKRGRNLLSLKSAASKALGQRSPELLKSGRPSANLADPRDTSSSLPEQPLQKRLKLSDSRTPPGKFLNFRFTQVEPVSFAYPSDLPDPSPEDLLTITEIRLGAKPASPAIIDLSVSILFYFFLTHLILLIGLYSDFMFLLRRRHRKVLRRIVLRRKLLSGDQAFPRQTLPSRLLSLTTRWKKWLPSFGPVWRSFWS